ncbi:MAG: hypothetical protein HC849_06030 [Oscillatoriales cyanobacterium RU_3_3]|nr:hypothetical protein [Oscillatoriales cyanobacterium RU_3_3]
MSPNLKFDGQTTATLRIASKEVILRGKLSGAPLKKLTLVYHAQKLDEAIYLGTPAETMQELARFFNFAGNATEQLNSFKDLFGSKLKPIIDSTIVFSSAGNDPLQVGSFLSKLGGVLKYMATLNDPPPSEMNNVRVWVIDIAFNVDVPPPPSSSPANPPSLPPGEIALGLAFEFEGMKLLNIELLSAGIQFTATVS